MNNLILDDQLYIELESMRVKLYGQSFHDPETDARIEIPGLNSIDYKELFEYNNSVSDIYFRFKDSHDEIFLSLKLLELFDSIELKKNNIRKSQYLTYHIKYWYIKLATTFELAVNLIGIIYDLRISEKFINFKIIENNKYVKSNSNVYACFKKLDTLVASDIRNKIIHHQKFDNDLLFELSLSDLFNIPMSFGDEVENNINVDILIKEYYTKTDVFTQNLNLLIQSLTPVFKEICGNKEFGQ